MYYKRSAWTNKPNNSVSFKGPQTSTTFHYPGFGNAALQTKNWSLQKCFNQIRTWEGQHQARGSKNIEYNFFVLPTGDVVEGRGFRQSGANGTSAANRYSISVQVLIGDNEPLNSKFLKGIAEVLKLIKTQQPQALNKFYPHKHWVGTRCPGPAIEAALKNGTINKNMTGSVSVPAAGTSAPKPASKPAAKPSTTSKKLKVDGRFGKETVKEIQRRLGVAVDGRAGKSTWTALQKKKGMRIVDGIISKQSYKAEELGNGIVPGKYWNYTGRRSTGSNLIRAIQKDLGVAQDGILYTGTIKALQTKLNNDPNYLK